jgi:hypothetical protein
MKWLPYVNKDIFWAHMGATGSVWHRYRISAFMASNPIKPAASSKTMSLMIVKPACFFMLIQPVDVVYAVALDA